MHNYACHGNTVFNKGFGVGPQKDIIVIFAELFSVINMDRCHGWELFTMEKWNYYVLINYIRRCIRGEFTQITLRFLIFH